MKGVKLRCYGLLLVCSIMLGLSLNVFSDASALKYTIDVLPFWEPGRNTSNPNFLSDPVGFQITSSSDFDSTLVDSLSVSSWQSGSSGGSSFSGPCNFVAFDSLPRVLSQDDDITLKYSFNGFDFSTFSPSYSVDPCLTLSSMTDYNTPLLLDPLVRDNLPYRFPFSGIYRSSSGRLTDDGPIMDTKFDFLSLYGSGPDNADNVPSVVKSLNIPFGYPSSYQSLSSGTPIEFSGELVLDPVDFTDFSFNADVMLVQTITDGSGGSPSYSTCSTSIGRDEPDDPSSVFYLRYSCPTTISSFYDPFTTVPWFNLIVDFSYSGSSTKLRMLIFDSSVSITNNDSTDGGSWFDSMFGSNPSSAFGSITRTEVVSEPNFLDSLINLFSFNFINPFQPIFSMFSPEDTCASIPVLAAMLHSEETTVCPWFSSETRTIVTPVISLVSMMLLFGFAVRWLGSRSGNFVEDAEVDSGGYHFANKYRRKK